jgi:molecular chaperone HtpG
MTEGRTISMRTDFAGVVELLARQLYGTRDAAVRELLQNASDAIARREALQPAHEGRIAIEVDRRRRTLVFRDDGIGMNRAEVTAFLAVVGASGTRRERERFDACADEERSESLIGCFGVGVLASLQVADRIVVRTRRWRGMAGWRWEWDGSPTCHIAREDRVGVGTEVSLHIGRGHDDALDPDRIAQTVIRCGDLLPRPITLRAGGRYDGMTPLNRGTAPWHEDAWSEPGQRDDALRSFVEPEGGGALVMIPVHLEAPVRAWGALFVPRGGAAPSVGGKLSVYVRRMRVGDTHAGLVPPWASFVTGVIESPDLRPSASRETLQHDVTFGVLRDQLGALILEALSDLAATAPSRAGRLFDTQPSSFKSLALSEDAFFDHAGHLLPFASNRGDVRLGEALAAAPGGQARTVVHFWEGDARPPRAEGDTLVLDARAALDRAVLDRLAARFSGRIELVPVEDATEAPRSAALPEEEHAKWRDLEEEVAAVLYRHGICELPVRVERFEPPSLPSLFGSGPGAVVGRRLSASASGGPWLVPALAEATREISPKRGDGMRVALNAGSPVLEDLRASAAETGPLREAAIVCLVVSALLRENALVTETHVPVLDHQLRRLLAHTSRSLNLAPSLPGLAGAASGVR